MNPKLICSGWILLILLFTYDQGWAKPMTEVQTLSKFLEEDLGHPLGSEETEQEQAETLLTGAMKQQDTPFPWSRNPQEEASISESAFQRLFSDLLDSSRSYRARSKKGLSRGCFGVKLDRIGALSGMGC